ncbi:MAG: tRNA pseudouridine(55) synthase, partial [Lachnospiraceae bacterium]|nr:tRNA pseudouridine(55) synthase [Lachnospiraceae bacterium]
SGEVLEKREPRVSAEELTKAIRSFIGGYHQVPPMYSAKKVEGHKLYDLARAGKTVERKPQFVEIFDIEILSMNLPEVSVRVECGKGTYIRSLCEDIAAKCGELAVMTDLKRTGSGPFKAADSYRLSDLQALKDAGRLGEAVMPTDSAFPGLKRIVTNEESEKRLLNGNKIPAEFFKEVSFSEGEQVLLYTSDDRFAGLYRFSAEENLLIPVKMFLGA